MKLAHLQEASIIGQDKWLREIMVAMKEYERYYQNHPGPPYDAEDGPFEPHGEHRVEVPEKEVQSIYDILSKHFQKKHNRHDKTQHTDTYGDWAWNADPKKYGVPPRGQKWGITLGVYKGKWTLSVLPYGTDEY